MEPRNRTSDAPVEPTEPVEPAEPRRFSWKLKEIVLVAMICIVFGVVYLAAVYLSSFINAAGTPWGLGFLGNELVFGIWFMAATLSAYILQKPGVALVSEMLAALIEVLLGNMYGPMVIVTGFVQGIGAEAAFAAFRYRRFNWASMLLAAVLSCVVSFGWSFVRSGYGELAVPLVAMFFLVRLASSVAFSAVLVKVVGDRLARTGLLKSYALGRSRG